VGASGRGTVTVKKVYCGALNSPANQPVARDVIGSSTNMFFPIDPNLPFSLLRTDHHICEGNVEKLPTVLTRHPDRSVLALFQSMAIH
jgi:hypothetical protein